MASSANTRDQVQSAYLQWGDPNKDPIQNVGTLFFDVVYSEDHEHTTEVTEHPVEEGANIVDHVRPNTDRISLEVFVSQTPVDSKGGMQLLPLTLSLPAPGLGGGFLAGGVSGLLDKGLQAIGLEKGPPTEATYQVYQLANPTLGVSSADADYVKAAHDQLLTLRDTATLLTITTPNALYTNMLLETIKMRRDASTGTSANFSLEFRQIRVVSSKVVPAPLPTVLRANPINDKGKKDVKPAPGPMQSISVRNGIEAGLLSANPAAGLTPP